MTARTVAVSLLLFVATKAEANDVPTPASSSRMLSGYLEAWEDTAPSRLVVFGQYSDRRFIDMMTPHHAMAVEMAEMALMRAMHPELKEMAQSIVDSQAAEIDEMKTIKKELFGTERTPSRMSPIVMDNMGMASMEELQQASDFDCAFIDSMIPHHAAAIPMASVVLRRSQNDELKALARDIVDAQSREIGQMQEWHATWCASLPAVP
jgi:uncharacterized protein (DUF305 family)